MLPRCCREPILLAQGTSSSTFVGFDAHAGSVEAARKAAAQAGVADRITFEIAGAEEFAGQGYDLICVFNALHEWGDPIRAASHIRRALAPDGTWMFTEPRTDDALVELDYDSMAASSRGLAYTVARYGQQVIDADPTRFRLAI